MIYTIKKDKHSSGIHFQPHFGINEIEYKAVFLTPLWYPRTSVLNTGVNKLCGFSFGSHHKYSIRIGWQPDFNQEETIIFYTYLYKNNQRFIIEMFREQIRLNEVYSFRITCINDALRIYFNQTKVYQGVFAKPECEWGYYLYPYFGGTSPAPQEFKMEINKNKIN
jgi:hypothetical protein